MWTFVIAGIVYLIGVGVVLMIRPSYMFTPDGDWKEFGIGQNEDRYTPFPFWLFCLVWAIVSYMAVMICIEVAGVGTATGAGAGAGATISPRNARRNRLDLDADSAAGEAVELPKGYYVLNRKATKLSGVPKYVYLGQEEP